jgi:hypothetical protein
MPLKVINESTLSADITFAQIGLRG